MVGRDDEHLVPLLYLFKPLHQNDQEGPDLHRGATCTTTTTPFYVSVNTKGQYCIFQYFAVKKTLNASVGESQPTENSVTILLSFGGCLQNKLNNERTLLDQYLFTIFSETGNTLPTSGRTERLHDSIGPCPSKGAG